MQVARWLAAASVAAALTGCWVAACVEPVPGTSSQRCFDEQQTFVDELLWTEEPECDDQGNCHFAGDSLCVGEWVMFADCASLGYVSACPGSEYRVLPGEERVACP